MKRATGALALTLFRRALEVEAGERAEFIAAACGADDGLREHVERLLREDESDGGLLDSPCELPLDQLFGEETDALAPGARVSGYVLQGVLGSGGMGTVYEALQDRPRRRVALKTLRSRLPSDDGVRRFLQEAETLARLRHPGIAQVFESGLHETANGAVPYFAMEFVEDPRGLVEHATYAGLDERARLELFLAVCDAVHHGHQRGVIHRDLKPGNVLVGMDGRPKVIDFGLARVFDPAEVHPRVLETAGGELFGTLAYLAPERLVRAGSDGEPRVADSRGDVYALGVILFELLTGELPYDLHGRSVIEALGVLQSGEPARLRAVCSGLAPELEWIVSAAVERDPDRRYASVSELAADVRRHLAGEPVTVGAPTTAYRLRKLARRHRVLLASTAAVILALAIGLVQARVEARARERALATAVQERAKAEAVGAFLRKMLASVSPMESGSEARVLDLLRESAQIVDREVEAGTEARAVVENVLAEGFLGLRSFDEAAAHLDAAEAYVDERAAPDDALSLEIAANRVRWLYLTRQEEEALALGREVAVRAELVLGPAHPASLSVGGTLAETLLGVRRLDEAEAQYEEHLAHCRAALGEGHRDLIGPLGGLALVRMHAGEENRAEFEHILELAEQRFPSGHWRVWNARFNLASALHKFGEYEDAEESYRAVLAAVRDRFPEEHPFYWSVLGNLGSLLVEKGDFEEALPTLAESVRIAESNWGPGNRHALNSRTWMADAERGLGRPAEADAICRDLLQGYADTLAVQWGLGLRVHAIHSFALLDQGLAEEAEAAFRAGRAFGLCHGDVEAMSEVVAPLVHLDRDRGRTEAAEQILRGLIDEGPADSSFVQSCEVLLRELER